MGVFKFSIYWELWVVKNIHAAESNRWEQDSGGFQPRPKALEVWVLLLIG